MQSLTAAPFDNYSAFLELSEMDIRDINGGNYNKHTRVYNQTSPNLKNIPMYSTSKTRGQYELWNAVLLLSGRNRPVYTTPTS